MGSQEEENAKNVSLCSGFVRLKKPTTTGKGGFKEALRRRRGGEKEH
jgi:hypothetical protein